MHKRVLFVDDEPSIRSIYEMLGPFLGDNTSVVTSGSGQEALNLFSEGNFDVIVSDLIMPEMSGAELLSRVSSISPGTARVVMSGFADEITIAKCLLAAHRYFTKPFDPIALATAIQSLTRAGDAAPDSEIRKLVGTLDALPTPSETYLGVMKALNAPNTSITEIAMIVEADPSLAAKVLQAVNSAMFGANRKIVSLSEALQMIGLHVLRALVLTIQIFDYYENPRLKSELKQLWNHSVDVARHARQICVDRGWPLDLAEEAFLCGLLHDVGRLILAGTPENTRAKLFPQYRFYRDAENACRTSRVIEAEAGAYLLSLWGLPESIITTVRDHIMLNALPTEAATTPSAGLALALAHEMESPPQPLKRTDRSTVKAILLISSHESLTMRIQAECRRTDCFFMAASSLKDAFQTFHDLHFDMALVDPELFPYPPDQVKGHLRQVNADTNVRLLSNHNAPPGEYMDLFQDAPKLGV